MKKINSTSLFAIPLRYFVYSILLASLLFLINSCKKNADVTGSSFVWTYGSTSYTANIKGAYAQSLSVTPIIIAGTGTSLNSIGIGPRISIPSFTPGTYTLTAGVYHLDYVDDQGTNRQSVSGSITITSYDNSGLSGSFTSTLTNNIVLTGSFTSVPVSQ